MKSWSEVATALDDGINPIAVKEFRQGVQGRGVVLILFLFLLVNLGVVGGYVMLSPNADTSIEGGRNIFIGLLGILQFTCMILVPLYTGGRMSQERNNTDLDLLYVTTLSPSAIVRGKYLTAMALTLLIFSASMPFMILTYLFRGIDLPSIFFAIAASFLCCAVANAAGIAVGCIPSKGAFRSFGYVLFFLFLPMFPSIISSLGISITYGMGSWLGTWQFWTIAGTVLLMAALAIGWLYVFSVALLSPKPSNRMLIPRVYLTAAWAISGAAMGGWSYAERNMAPLSVWLFGTCVAIFIFTVAALGERDAWSARVRRTIPRRDILRAVAFLFYTGSAGGIVWCILMFAATMLAAHYAYILGAGLPGVSDITWLCQTMTTIYGYVLCYCLTVAALRPVLYPHAPTPSLPVAALLFGAAVEIVPYLLAFFLERNWWDVLPWYSLGSPLVLTMGNAPAKELAGTIVTAWVVLSVAIAIPWAVGQWRRFVPYEFRSTSDTVQDDSTALEIAEGS